MKRLLAVFALLWAAFSAIADGYMYLDVDGIQVHFTEIRFFDQYGGRGDALAYVALNQTVNLTGELGDVFSGSVQLNVQDGLSSLDFSIINIEISGGVSIKGHAYDSDSGLHVYTTTSGIQSIDLGSETWSAQDATGYDYLSNAYVYSPADGGEVQETTFMPATVSYPVDGSFDISLMVETYKCAYYWDGDDSTRHDFVWSWHEQNSTYFPTGTPAVGITYLPLYVSVNGSLSAETYVMALSQPELSGLPDSPNETRTASFTLVFDQGDQFFIGRSIHAEPRGGNDVYQLWVPQFISNGTESAGLYSFDFKDYSDNGGWSLGARMTGFSRLSVGEQSSATLENYDPYNGGTATVYYQRVK